MTNMYVKLREWPSNNDGKHLLPYELWYHQYIDKNNWAENWVHFPEEFILKDKPIYKKETSKDRLDQMGSLFDKFMLSPNSRYFCEKRQELYAIGSRVKICKNFEELMEVIPRYREIYEKLFLYNVAIDIETNEYKAKFAGFPTERDLKYGPT